ncbi:MAG: 2-iminoacetate synthase ThiH [Spirochaetaceae bacterium]
MSKFYSELIKWENFNFKKYTESVIPKDISNILLKESITILDTLALISPAADQFLEEIATKSNRLTQNEFGKTVQIYTPLYLSNYCKNRCTYCGFNIDNDILRSKLNIDEIIAESNLILNLGIKHILILTGGDRVNTPLEYIEDAIKILSSKFVSISVEIYALNEHEYERLINIGVENVTIYQETYNKKRYEQVHLSGEKSSYNFRLSAPERAAKAGIRSVNLGALLGLDKPIDDFIKTALHCKFIEQNYDGCEVAISFPRIKNAFGVINKTETVNDKLLAKFIMAFRLFMPKSSISISTREDSNLRNNLLHLGVTKMSASSKTSVGGHSSDKNSKQFEISDLRTVSQLDKDLKGFGYQPVYKNWVYL